MREKLLNVKEIPLSLYIHLPWCKKKCPFCDFNSYQIISELPEEKYCQALLNDFFDVLPNEPRKIHFKTQADSLSDLKITSFNNFIR